MTSVSFCPKMDCLGGMDTDSTRRQVAAGLSKVFLRSIKARNRSQISSPRPVASLRSTSMSTGNPFSVLLMDECCSNISHLTQERNGH